MHPGMHRKTALWEGLTRTMNHRERVLAAIGHRRPDRIPLDSSIGGWRKDAWRKVADHFGTLDEEKVNEALGLDIRYSGLEPSSAFAEKAIPCPFQLHMIGEGRASLVIPHENGWYEDEQGVCRVPNSTGQYWHYAYHPLNEATEDKVSAFRLPDPSALERYDGVIADLDRWKQTHFVIATLQNIFKSSWELRGFNRYMTDLVWEPRIVQALADIVLECRIAQSRHLTGLGIDAIQVAGDVGMQTGMMISPHTWRTYFKPRLATWIAETRKVGPVFFSFHSDGNIDPIIGDLVEIGFDIINPLQPECMDVVSVKRRFGDSVCLHGTLSCQRTLPFGTERDVEMEVLERIHCCGSDGGLILCPSNPLTEDVPLSNVLALYSTAANASLGDRDE